MTAEESRIVKLEYLRQVTMERYGFGPNAMRRIRVCPECGCPSEADEANCLSCGVRMPKENLYDQYKKRHHFCSRCDTVVAEYMQFCPQCGTRIPSVKPSKVSNKYQL